MPMGHRLRTGPQNQRHQHQVPGRMEQWMGCVPQAASRPQFPHSRLAVAPSPMAVGSSGYHAWHSGLGKGEP